MAEMGFDGGEWRGHLGQLDYFMEPQSPVRTFICPECLTETKSHDNFEGALCDNCQTASLVDKDNDHGETPPSTSRERGKNMPRDWSDEMDNDQDMRMLMRTRASAALMTGAKAGVGEVVGEAFVEAIDEAIIDMMPDKKMPFWLEIGPIKSIKPIAYALILRTAISYRILDPIVPKGWKNKLLIASEYAMMGRASYIVMKYGKPIIKSITTKFKKKGAVKNFMDVATDLIEDDE